MAELEVAPEAPPAPARTTARRGPGLRPALVVVGIAAFVVLVFGVGAALTGGGTGTPRTSATAVTVPSGPTHVRGTTLLARPAATVLDPIRQPGTPPADIVDSLAVPVGATVVGHTPSSGITLFDARERFTVPGTQAAVIAFYRAELVAMRWKVTDLGPARGHPGATVVLAQKAGSDGWYWEVGVVVSPTTFGAGSGSTGTTPFVLRLFEVNDAS